LASLSTQAGSTDRIQPTIEEDGMKAATLVATGQVVVGEVDDLSVGPSDVLIKVI
jgi:hypothetical protein